MNPESLSVRLRQAAGGLLGVAILVAAAVTGVAYAGGVFTTDLQVQAVVPAGIAPVRTGTPAQYRGVVVGSVTEADEGRTGTTSLTLRIPSHDLGSVPATVHARLVPRTLFGDQYVDLVAPDGPAPAALAAGASIPPDTSKATVELTTAATRLYDLVTAVHPAELSAALGAVADTLRGKGNQLGLLIDRADSAITRASPAADALLGELSDVAGLADQLATSAPDLLAALDNAVALSDTVTRHAGDLRRLLVSGTEATATTEGLLLDNADRFVRLTTNLDPVLGTVADHPGALDASVTGLKQLTDAVQHALSAQGPWITINAPLTLNGAHPYTSADCPRYGSLAGPNCPAAQAQQQPEQQPPQQPPESTSDEAGGTVGPVGSEPEQNALEQLVPPDAANSPGLLGVVLGPLVRGTTVLLGPGR